MSPKPRPDALFAGKYRLIRMLGKGGMGEVWLAEEEGPRNFRRRVAIKKLLARAEPGDVAHESFFAEAQVIARLDHPNIVRLVELGVAEETVFLALDYVDGPSLDRLVKKGGGPLSPAAAAYMGREVARALEAVHELCDDQGVNYGVVHRDISPSNILIARDARVRLTDFGIARISGLGGERTETGVFKGKLPYMPPEQGRGEPFDRRADIFSLGLTLLEALTGKRVRRGETQSQLMIMIATRAIAPARDIVPGLPAALAAVIDRATAFDPRERTPDAGRLAAELDEVLRSFGPSAEQEARVELRRRVDAALTAMGEPVTGAHARQATPSHPSLQSTPVAPGTGSGARVNTPISEVHARGPGAELGPSAGPPARIPPQLPALLPPDAGPPSSRSLPTVLERRPSQRDPSSPGEPGIGGAPDLFPGLPASPGEPPRQPLASAPHASSSPRASSGRGRFGLALLLGIATAAGLVGAIVLWRAVVMGPPPAGTAAPPSAAAPEPATAAAPVSAPAPASAAALAPEPATATATAPSLPGSAPALLPPGKAGAPRVPGPLPTGAAPAAESTDPGTLQVVVIPWADVSVDGRPAGSTPMAPISLPPGPHTVVLRNAELGAARTLSVVIKPGQPSLLRVDLRRTESP